MRRRCLLLLLVSSAGFASARVAAETGGAVTVLYALDPLASTLSFGDGGYGHVVQDHASKNRNGDLDFGQYGVDRFTVGIEGGRVGAIVDVGTPQDLWERYRYHETVGQGQGFVSIRFVEGRVVIRKGDDGVQPLKEAALLFERPGAVKADAPVAVGHIYLVRIVDEADAAYERVVKVLVLAHAPGQAATIRWERLK